MCSNHESSNNEGLALSWHEQFMDRQVAAPTAVGVATQSALPSTAACTFPDALLDPSCDGILYKGDSQNGDARRPLQRKPPHLDYAREYKVSGSHAKTRATIAALTESHQRQQIVKEEAYDRDRAAEKFTTTFVETRFATCGAPTLNTKSVLIERQRRKADKTAAIVPVDPVNHLKDPSQEPPETQYPRRNTVKERKAGVALAARTIKIEEAIRRAYGSQVLDLKALELIRIPSQVFGTMLRQLARLIHTVNVSRNALREIPREFCVAFPEAETLMYKENTLDKLPEEISTLAYLKHLNAECNQLMTLPSHLPKSMEVMNVSRNRIQRVPNLHELTRLVEMDLSYNLLQLLPNGFMALVKLKVLRLAGNRLVTLATLPRMTSSTLDILEADSAFVSGVDGNQANSFGDGDGGDREQEKKQWRVEEDPDTNDPVYFHIPTKQVTRVKPACFRVSIPTLRLPSNLVELRETPNPMDKEHAAQILKRFPEGWEIVLGDATSTQIQYRNHCTGETFAALPSALNRLGDLTYLHILDVSGNQLQELPPSIGNLVRLKRLEAENNRLLRLPDAFHNLQALQTIKLGMNALAALPPSISLLSSLAELDLKLNRLQTLPPTFGDLPRLEALDLSSNALEALPSSFLRLKKLKTLKLHSNLSLTSAAGGFTPEVLASGDISRILWQLQHQLQCELRGAQPPVPSSRVVGVGDESWTTDMHLNREFARAVKAAQTSLCLDFHWKRLTLAEFPPAFFTTLGKLRELRLSGHRLETIPASFSSLAELRVLQLRKNGIQSIDDDVFTLSDGCQSFLEEIDLEYNQLGALPKSIGNLRRLRVLRAANNQLTDLPKEISCLSASLKELYVAHNRLVEAPCTLGKLDALEHLDVSYNQLRTLDTMSFDALIRLRILRASANQLSALPQSLSQSVPLEELSIAGNLFVEFPLSVLQLGATLRQLQIQSNKIFRLPFEFGDAMVVLESVASDGNPFLSPPAEVMRIGVNAIQAYLRKRQQRVIEMTRLLEALALSFDPNAFVMPKLCALLTGVGQQAQNGGGGQELPLPEPLLPFLTADHLAAFDRAVDQYVNGAFYLRVDTRGADLVNELLLRTHFSIAQRHHRSVLDDLVRLCDLIRSKKWADKIDFRYDLERPWGRRGELVGVYSVNPDVIYQEQPRLPSILSVIRTRVHHGFEEEAFTRDRREIETAIDQYVGVYGPVGVAHDDVPFYCGCEELLRFNKMHWPCYRRGWTLVQMIYTEEEAARREQDEQRITEALRALRPQIETFLRTEEGEKRFHKEVKEVKIKLRESLRDLEKKLVKTKKRWKAQTRQLAQKIKQEERQKQQYEKAAGKKSSPVPPAPPVKTVAEVKECEEQQERVNRLEERVKEMTKEFEHGKKKLGFGYHEFMDDVVTKLLDRVSGEVIAQLVRQQREKAIQFGWRRPWDGPGGRDFEEYKKLVRRKLLNDGTLEQEDHGDPGEASDNSEISEVKFEGYDDLVSNLVDGDADPDGDEGEEEEAEMAAQRAALLANLKVSDVSSDDESDDADRDKSQDSEL